jgi:ligand-binding SRPBCC domain-containing protein
LKTYLYKTEQFLPTDIGYAWDFFSSPKNLSLITPASLDFKILSQLEDEEIYEGMIIDYTVRPLFGISVRWKTEICAIEKPLYFTDRQLTGPYSVWIHTHTFIEENNGITMIDEVVYQLPLGIIGKIMHALFVKKRIEGIFEYRKLALQKIFVTHDCISN